MTPLPSSATAWQERWQTYSATALRTYHRYGSWLVSISWKRFIVLSLALLVVVGMVHDSPPFTWRTTETVELPQRRLRIKPPRQPAEPATPQTPSSSRSKSGDTPDGVDISIGKDGIHITPKMQRSADAASSAQAAASQAHVAAEAAASAALQGVQINLQNLPATALNNTVREALEDAKRQLEDSLRTAKEEAAQAARDAEEARRDAEQAYQDLVEQAQEVQESRTTTRTRRIGIGDAMLQLASFLVIASGIIKATYKGRMQAEVKAAQATETAEAESLKRQVAEARMAAMQAQVEPHFLFNTLASIDHLIETDPPRASQMQKNLIALLRASMPSMREASGQGGNNGSTAGVRELGRELAVIRPYLEILKVRMEERLDTDIQVPDGLLSAEFPPMMIQTLVENSIKHGLEPKAEGGTLSVKAEIVHGKLQVTVADTGLGFGKAGTSGTGVGLANIRERLQLLYGQKASLTVAENQPSGTVVTVTVPYKTVEGAGA